MGVLWERLAGDTATFALKLSFLDDPDGANGTAPDLAVSWGGFQIWVNGSNLCEHHEPGVSGSLSEVTWYLLPLLEWFAAHWEPMFHEERLPGRNAAPEAWTSLRFTAPGWTAEAESPAAGESEWSRWTRDHCLITGRDGGLFPDLAIRRFREWAELSWGETRLAGMPKEYRFVAKSGAALLSVGAVAQSIFDVLESAARYLVGKCPDSPRIRRLVAAVRALATSAKEEKRLAWLVGIGAQTPARVRKWNRLSTNLLERCGKSAHDRLLAVNNSPLVMQGCCHAQMMFGSLTPDLSENDLLQIAGLVVEQWKRRTPASGLEELNDSIPYDFATARAWKQGYNLAEDFAENLDLPKREPADLDAILERCGIDLRSVCLEDSGTRGLAVAGPRHRPLIVVNKSHPTSEFPSGRRFTIAHELCHLLHDRTAARELAMASGPWAPMGIEQRANAFAAMILMPRGAIRDAMASLTNVDPNNGDILRMAQNLQVSRRSLLWHLKNLGFLDDALREAIELESDRAQQAN